MKHRIFALVLVLTQGLLAGCEEVSGSLTLQLDRPSGFAVVDDGWLVVGQENGDVASFVSLDPSSGTSETLMSPSFYLPLHWNILPESRSWIGSENQAAVYVSGLTGEVEFINFDQIRNGDARFAASRSADFFPTAVGTLSISADACEAPCVVKAWASLPSRGTVVEFEIIQSDGEADWQLLRELNVGGSPWEMAAGLDETLILSDLSNQRIVKVHLADETTETLQLDSVVGPISVSTDGATLFVSRPQLRDALIVKLSDLSSSSFENFLAPTTSCIAACDPDAESEACDGLHPYNKQVCLDNSDKLTTSRSYEGLFLGLHTSHVVALGAGAGDQAWVSTCDEETRVYNEVFAVLGIQSGMRFVGARDDTGAFELITDSWCNEIRSGATTRPSVFLSALESPSDVLSSQEELDPVFSLLDVEVAGETDEDEPDSFEVIVARWALGDYRFSVTWEGLSDGQLSRPLGGGVLTANGDGEVRLVDDLGLNLKRFDEVVQLGADLRLGGACEPEEPCGDLLVVTEGLTLTDACLNAISAQDEDEAACLLERRIESVVELDGNTYWELDREIPSECRPTSGRIGYEVRAAREFSVVSDLKPYRVGPGERFGFGTRQGATEPIHVKFRDVDGDSPCATPEGLVRGETGTVQLLDGNRVSQGTTWPTGIWSLSQSLDGLDFDFDLTLPSDLKVWRSETHGTIILLSLTGSNRLVYFRPLFGEGATVDNNPIDLFRSAEWYQDKSRFWLIQ